MKAPRISDEYETEVEDFLQFVQKNASELDGKYFCPCVTCLNGRRQSLNDIKSHVIYVMGFVRLTQIGYGMVNCHTCPQPLTLSRFIYKPQIVWKT